MLEYIMLILVLYVKTLSLTDISLSASLIVTASHVHVIIFINGGSDKSLCFLPVADLIHVLSSVPRDLNFIDHTSNIGSKVYGPSDLANNISC
jgi:hypothetical protein